MFIDPSIQYKTSLLEALKVKTIHDPLGISFTHIAKDKVMAIMPVDDRTKQPFGLLHGGASVVLAESCASIGAWLNINDDLFTTVGVEINANHIRGVREGMVTGTATPVRVGSQIQVWQTEIHDSQQRLVCTSRCTLAVIKKLAN